MSAGFRTGPVGQISSSRALAPPSGGPKCIHAPAGTVAGPSIGATSPQPASASPIRQGAPSRGISVAPSGPIRSSAWRALIPSRVSPVTPASAPMGITGPAQSRFCSPGTSTRASQRGPSSGMEISGGPAEGVTATQCPSLA